MKELIAVLRATMSGQMNIFTLGKKNNKGGMSNKIGGYLLILLLTIAILFSFGSYAFMIAEPLHTVNQTYLVIILFAVMSTILVFMQGVYRSQGILFDAKDSDLLFSMPIKKKTIFAARLIKLTAFEYIWTFISMVPAFAVYWFLEKPPITSLVTLIVIFITIPIIPIILASIIGYIIQGVSSKFKIHKLFELLFNIIFIILIFVLSFKLQSFVENIAQNAKSINDMITKLYYPIGLYGECLTDFRLSKIAIILGMNILVFGIYIYLFSLMYFNIVSKLSEKHSSSNFKMKELKTSTVRMALLKKELKRYFSSPMYVLNTLFGPLLLMISSVYIIVSQKGFEGIVQGEFGEVALGYMPVVYMLFMMFIIFTTSVTASSISLEGKSLWLTKSLPVREKDIFISKMIVNLLATIPFCAISLVVFSIKLKFSAFYVLASLVEIIIISLLVSVMGLVVNLKYPKLNFKSDIEVVKQSMSVVISLYVGFAFVGLAILIYKLMHIANLQLYVSICLAFFAILTATLWKILMSYGVKRFRELNN